MIETKVTPLGPNEHRLDVTIEQDEYDRLYDQQAAKLAAQVRLPGFRPGKAPMAVVRKQFGSKIHDETVSELLQQHYADIIERSGLEPAVQPELEAPRLVAGEGLKFSMKIATWPEVELGDLGGLSFTRTEVVVETSDIEAVIERLMKSQVRFEEDEQRHAQEGDQVHIDFVGFVDGEPFEGGRGEDVALVLGEGRFIPGFEEQLIGCKAGDELQLEVTFPEDYQSRQLAGKPASFQVKVRSVARAVHPENEDELAQMLGFEHAAALREDVERRLTEEARQASRDATFEAALDALLAAHDVELPEMLVAEDMRETMGRIVQNMKRQGVEVTPEQLRDPEFRQEVRRRSERGLKLSVLLQAVRRQAGIEVEDAEIDAEIDRQSLRYPEEQRDQFRQWIKGQREQIDAIRAQLLEAKCIEYIVAQANTSVQEKTLSAWQEENAGGQA